MDDFLGCWKINYRNLSFWIQANDLGTNLCFSSHNICLLSVHRLHCLVRAFVNSHVSLSTGPYTCQQITPSSCIHTHTHHGAVWACRYPNESHGDLDVDRRPLEGGEDIHLNHTTRSGSLGAADTPQFFTAKPLLVNVICPRRAL